MKLDMECVRDLLIAIEENIILDDNLQTQILNLNDMSKLAILSPYNKPHIAYCISKSKEAGLIDAIIKTSDSLVLHHVKTSTN